MPSTGAFSPDVKLDLDRLYESNLERTAQTVEFYRELYGLPTIEHTDAVTPELFAYCSHRNYFINIIAHAGPTIFLRRALGEQLGWELPGSAVQAKGDESVQDAALRIMRRDIANIDIGELRPIAHLRKEYTHGQRTITHEGLSFLGRVRNITPEEASAEEDIKGRFIRVEDKVELDRLAQPDRQLCDLAFGQIAQSDYDATVAIERELDSTISISPLIRALHQRLLGPIGRHFSSAKLRAEILKTLNDNILFLDVSCGDDLLIFDVARRAQICVGNDVHWPQVAKLLRYSNEQNVKNVIFTNHNACHLDFNRQFDLTLCKNMLHHMRSRQQLIDLLASLQRVSKCILIVDPEDPDRGPLKARAWHWYYVRLLHDQGERFFSYSQFQQTLGDFFREAKNIEFKKIGTIKGNYMFCTVTLR